MSEDKQEEWEDCAFCNSRNTFKFSPNGRLAFYGCNDCGQMTNPDGSRRGSLMSDFYKSRRREQLINFYTKWIKDARRVGIDELYIDKMHRSCYRIALDKLKGEGA